MGAGVLNVRSEAFAGAVGAYEFAVHFDVGVGDGVFFLDEAGEGEEAVALGDGGGLEVEVADDDDADVVFIPAGAVFSDADVLAFVGEVAELPDAAGTINGEVVGDVDHAALEVGLLDDLEMAGGVGEGIGEKRFAVAGVVDGDAIDAVHGAAVGEDERQVGPGFSGDDVAVFGRLRRKRRGELDGFGVDADGWAGIFVDEMIGVDGVGEFGGDGSGRTAGCARAAAAAAEVLRRVRREKGRQ